MSDIKISLETTETPGAGEEITVVRVDGVIDTMTASELEKVTNSLLTQRRYNIIVDLGGVDYISSAGWGIFISNIREIRQNDGDIKLARMIPNVYEIFELLEFDSILKAFDNISKAKMDFGVRAVSEIVTPRIQQPEPISVTKEAQLARSEPAATPHLSMGPAPLPKPPMADVDRPSQRVGESKTEAALRAAPATKPATATQEALAEAVMELVGKDPFLSVGDIRREMAKEFSGIGFLKTWKTLRKLGLGSKKKRFYFARTRRSA